MRVDLVGPKAACGHVLEHVTEFGRLRRGPPANGLADHFLRDRHACGHHIAHQHVALQERNDVAVPNQIQCPGGVAAPIPNADTNPPDLHFESSLRSWAFSCQGLDEKVGRPARNAFFFVDARVAPS